jgi:hypothetical protein
MTKLRTRTGTFNTAIWKMRRWRKGYERGCGLGSAVGLSRIFCSQQQDKKLIEATVHIEGESALSTIATSNCRGQSVVWE